MVSTFKKYSTIGSACLQMVHGLKVLVGTLEVSSSDGFPKRFCCFVVFFFTVVLKAAFDFSN